jgi:hypothetical protein
MDNTTLAHIGAEFVLIGGVAFYFQRKTKNLEEEIEQLKREQQGLINMIESMGESLERLGGIVMAMRGASATPQPVSAFPAAVAPTATPVSFPPRPHGKRPHHKKKRSRKQESSSSSSESSSSDSTIDEKELDKELEGEYKLLKEERTDGCDGDVCEISIN